MQIFWPSMGALNPFCLLGFVVAGQYAFNGSVLIICESKNFYLIAREAQNADELKDCRITYDKASGRTTYSEGEKALLWFQNNKKVVLKPISDGPGASSASAVPVKKKKLVPTVLELDDF